jgi:malonyl-CoA O-methyltransferase
LTIECPSVFNFSKPRRDGKLPATYEVIYGHAWRGEKSAPALPGGEQVMRFTPRS